MGELFNSLLVDPAVELKRSTEQKVMTAKSSKPEPLPLPVWLFVGSIMVGCISLAVGSPIFGVIFLAGGLEGLIHRIVRSRRS